MNKLLINMTAVAIVLAAAPASAQLLGGGGLGGQLGGGLGGGLGGQLGGGLGAPIGAPSLPTLPDRIDRSVDSKAQGTLSTKGQRHIDTRKGEVSASRSADAGLTGALDTHSTNPAAPAANLAGSANGAATGSANAQLIGTDTVRSTAGQAAGTARDRIATTRDTATSTAGAVRDRATMTAGAARDRATTTVGTVRDRAATTAAAARDRTTGAAGNAVGTVRSKAATLPDTTGSIAGMAMGARNAAGNAGLGNLALAGSGAANGQGMFAVTPGMPVTDAKGHVLGTVQSVATSGRGRIEQVRMKVGNKLATLPASNFSGNGDVLVSAMGKGEVKKSAAQ